MKKLNFSAVDVTGLSTYTNELEPGLILEKAFSTRSMELFNKYLANTGTNKLNVLDSTVLYQDGSDCKTASSGSTIFTQQTITAEQIRVEKSWCAKDFFKYWQSQFVNSRSDLPFEEQIIESELAKIAKTNEIAIWQSEKDGDGGANLDKFDGLIEILSGNTAVVSGITTDDFDASGTTVDTIKDQVELMIENIPSDILTDQVTLFLSPKAFNLWVKALSTAEAANSLFSIDNNNFERVHPLYTNVKLVAVPGLDKKDDILVLTFNENIYHVVPKDGDDLDIKFTPADARNKEHLMTVEFLMGVQVGRPEYVVTNF